MEDQPADKCMTTDIEAQTTQQQILDRFSAHIKAQRYRAEGETKSREQGAGADWGPNDHGQHYPGEGPPRQGDDHAHPINIGSKQSTKTMATRTKGPGRATPTQILEPPGAATETDTDCRGTAPPTQHRQTSKEGLPERWRHLEIIIITAAGTTTNDKKWRTATAGEHNRTRPQARLGPEQHLLIRKRRAHTNHRCQPYNAYTDVGGCGKWQTKGPGGNQRGGEGGSDAHTDNRTAWRPPTPCCTGASRRGITQGDIDIQPQQQELLDSIMARDAPYTAILLTKDVGYCFAPDNGKRELKVPEGGSERPRTAQAAKCKRHGGIPTTENFRLTPMQIAAAQADLRTTQTLIKHAMKRENLYAAITNRRMWERDHHTPPALAIRSSGREDQEARERRPPDKERIKDDIKAAAIIRAHLDSGLYHTAPVDRGEVQAGRPRDAHGAPAPEDDANLAQLARRFNMMHATAVEDYPGRQKNTNGGPTSPDGTVGELTRHDRAHRDTHTPHNPAIYGTLLAEAAATGNMRVVQELAPPQRYERTTQWFTLMMVASRQTDQEGARITLPPDVLKSAILPFLNRAQQWRTDKYAWDHTERTRAEMGFPPQATTGQQGRIALNTRTTLIAPMEEMQGAECCITDSTQRIKNCPQQEEARKQGHGHKKEPCNCTKKNIPSKQWPSYNHGWPGHSAYQDPTRAAHREWVQMQQLSETGHLSSGYEEELTGHGPANWGAHAKGLDWAGTWPRDWGTPERPLDIEWPATYIQEGTRLAQRRTAVELATMGGHDQIAQYLIELSERAIVTMGENTYPEITNLLGYKAASTAGTHEASEKCDSKHWALRAIPNEQLNSVQDIYRANTRRGKRQGTGLVKVGKQPPFKHPDLRQARCNRCDIPDTRVYNGRVPIFIVKEGKVAADTEQNRRDGYGTVWVRAERNGTIPTGRGSCHPMPRLTMDEVICDIYTQLGTQGPTARGIKVNKAWVAEIDTKGTRSLVRAERHWQTAEHAYHTNNRAYAPSTDIAGQAPAHHLREDAAEAGIRPHAVLQWATEPAGHVTAHTRTGQPEEISGIHMQYEIESGRQSISAQDALYKARAVLIQRGHIEPNDNITMCWVTRIKKNRWEGDASPGHYTTEHRYVLQTARPAGAFHALLPQGAEVAIFTEKTEEGATHYHDRNERANSSSTDYTAMIMPQHWQDHEEEQDQWDSISEHMDLLRTTTEASARASTAATTPRHREGGANKREDEETRRAKLRKTSTGPHRWDDARFPAGINMTGQEAEKWTIAPIKRITAMHEDENAAWALRLMAQHARKLQATENKQHHPATVEAGPTVTDEQCEATWAEVDKRATEEWQIRDFGQSNNTKEMREAAREPEDWPAQRLHPRANKGIHYMCDPDVRTCPHCTRPPPEGRTHAQHLNIARALQRAEEERAPAQILRGAKQGTWIGHMGQVDRNAPRVCTQTGGNQPHTIPQLTGRGKGKMYAQTGLRWACPGCTRGQPKARMAVNWRCRRCRHKKPTEERISTQTIEDKVQTEKCIVMRQKRQRNEEDALYEEYMSRREQTLRGGFPTIASTRHDKHNTLTEGCVTPTVAQHELQGGEIHIRMHIVDLWSGNTTVKRIEEFCEATSNLMSQGHTVELTKLETRDPRDQLHQIAATSAAVSALAEGKMRALGPSGWKKIDMTEAVTSAPERDWLSRCNKELTRVLTRRHRECGRRHRRERHALMLTHTALKQEQQQDYKAAATNHRESLELAMSNPPTSTLELLRRMANLTRAGLLAGYAREPYQIQTQIITLLTEMCQESGEHAERLQNAHILHKEIEAEHTKSETTQLDWRKKWNRLTHGAQSRTDRAAKNRSEKIELPPPNLFVTDPNHNKDGQVHLTRDELQILQGLTITQDPKQALEAPEVHAPISIDQLPVVIMEQTKQLAREVGHGEPGRKEGYLHVNERDTREIGTHYSCVGYEITINTQYTIADRRWEYKWQKEKNAWTTLPKRG